MVTNIDRRKKEITIRYSNGKAETLQITGRAAAESKDGIDEPGQGTFRVVLYYSHEAGRKVAHYFRKEP
jgi:hypothetical protein